MASENQTTCLALQAVPEAITHFSQSRGDGTGDLENFTRHTPKRRQVNAMPKVDSHGHLCGKLTPLAPMLFRNWMINPVNAKQVLQGLMRGCHFVNGHVSLLSIRVHLQGQSGG